MPGIMLNVLEKLWWTICWILVAPIPQVGVWVAFCNTPFKIWFKKESWNPLEIYANSLSLSFFCLFSLGHPILYSAKDYHFSVERRRCYSFLTYCSHAYHGPLETSLFQLSPSWVSSLYFDWLHLPTSLRLDPWEWTTL